jgi:uncharacterized protein (TIGR02284 family)
MEKDKTLDVLNSLIIINNDRIEGYETASKETNENDLKTMFASFIQTSQNCKQELLTEVFKLGGDEVEGTKLSGKFFRVWMDVKAALTGKDRKAILNSCEYGEDQAVETYNNALENNLENISPEQLIMVNTQRNLIKAVHDKVKSMRDALVA